MPRRTLAAHTLSMLSTGALNVRSSVPPGWRPHLARVSVYALSCFFYSAVGIHGLALFARCSSAVANWPAQVAIVEALLVTAQGCWSFSSDVLYVGLSSRMHVVDRCSAIALTALQLLKFGVVVRLTVAEALWIWSGIGAAIFCKLKGYRALLGGTAADFRLWHTLWHASLPLAVGGFNEWRWQQARAGEGCSV